MSRTRTHRARRLTTLALASLAIVGLTTACTKKAPKRHASESEKRAEKAKPQTSKATAPAPRPTSARQRRRLADWIERGPLSPTMKASKTLQEVVTKVLLSKPQKDKPAATNPFAPLRGHVSKGLAATIRAANPKEIRLLGLEFELIFYAPKAKKDKGEDKAAFYLRTYLHPGARGPEFFRIAGRIPKDGKVNVEASPVDKYEGQAAKLFARAAQGLVKVLRDGRCQSLPMVSPEPLKAIMQPGPRTLRMLAGIRRARGARNNLCAGLSKINLQGSYGLRLDDLSFAVIGQNGRISGMLAGELKLDKDGHLALQLKQYRSMQ